VWEQSREIPRLRVIPMQEERLQIGFEALYGRRGMGSRRLLPSALRMARASLIATSLYLVTGAVRAATWSNASGTPALSELFVIDATGESGWPYGQEDVAGDGLATFAPSEQAIDLRTGYASTDASRLWVRVYVSDPNAVAPSLTAYVFVDADQSAATGGPAAAPAIDPALTTDPSPGGYEYVIGIRGNGTLSGLWEYRTLPAQYAAVNTNPASAAAEAGRDADPILLGATEHGYLQAMVDLGLIGLTRACSANLYVRSVDNGGGDLEAGAASACVAPDANGDHVPDVVIPPGGCASDAECPAAGRCLDGACVVSPPCSVDADCAATDQCTGGRCVARPGGTCMSGADCGDLVCAGGQCVACTPGGTECGAGRICAGNGRCAGNVVLAPDERVEGGAFHCGLSRSKENRRGLAGVLFLAGSTLLVRRFRPKQARTRRRS
jgi:hypothetical protein